MDTEVCRGTSVLNWLIWSRVFFCHYRFLTIKFLCFHFPLYSPISKISLQLFRNLRILHYLAKMVIVHHFLPQECLAPVPCALQTGEAVSQPLKESSLRRNSKPLTLNCPLLMTSTSRNTLEEWWVGICLFGSRVEHAWGAWQMWGLQRARGGTPWALPPSVKFPPRKNSSQILERNSSQWGWSDSGTEWSGGLWVPRPWQCSWLGWKGLGASWSVQSVPAHGRGIGRTQWSSWYFPSQSILGFCESMMLSELAVPRLLWF